MIDEKQLEPFPPDLLKSADVDPDVINWTCVSEYYKIPQHIIRKYAEYWNWENLLRYQRITECTIDYCSEELDKNEWEVISGYQKLSKKIIRKYAEYLNWDEVVNYQNLSNKFICEMHEYIDWYKLDIDITLEIIDHFHNDDSWEWYDCFYYGDFSISEMEIIIEKYHEYFDSDDWELLFKGQPLSEKMCINYRKYFEDEKVLAKYPRYEKFKFLTL